MKVYGVKPEVDAFDLSMIFKAAEMTADGRIDAPLHIQFVMGVKNAMPVDRDVLEFYVRTLRRIAPHATWTGAGIGRDQLTLVRWSLEVGGHARTGLQITSAWTSRPWRLPTRLSCERSLNSVPNTAAGRRQWRRHESCWDCLPSLRTRLAARRSVHRNWFRNAEAQAHADPRRPVQMSAPRRFAHRYEVPLRVVLAAENATLNANSGRS